MKKTFRFNIFFLALFISAISLQSCKKFLDAKANGNQIIPDTLGDLQALLDQYTTVNRADPFAAEIAADNYFVTATDILTVPENQQRIHRWEKDFLFPNSVSGDWALCYNNVYIANVVLDNIVNIQRTSANAVQWDNIKGQALMIRAKAFLQAAVIWTPAYDPATADTDLGLPLRLNSDFNQVSVRSSLHATYERIIFDLKESIPLLPTTAITIHRASKPAAAAFLARAYLAMTNYDSCLFYSNLTIQMHPALLDYNTDPDVNRNVSQTSQTSPFSKLSPGTPTNRLNPETLFQSRTSTPQIMQNSKARIDTNLYKSYNTNDWRKSLFYYTSPPNGGITSYRFRGSYDGSSTPFTGIATDEVYLMRAECYVRTNNTDLAMADLNSLMSRRWKGSFTPIAANDAADALAKILEERRKELVYRGLRWMDLKRLNKLGANITLTRVLAQTYTLPPNDFRYAMALPETVLSVSGMQQNPR